MAKNKVSKVIVDTQLALRIQNPDKKGLKLSNLLRPRANFDHLICGV